MKIRIQFHRWLGALIILAALFRCAAAIAGQNANPSLFSRAKMTPVDLNGMRVWLGEPVQVTSQLAWQIDWGHTDEGTLVPGVKHSWTAPIWSFDHITPFLARFPGGNLIAEYTMDPDFADTPLVLSGFQISKDGGAHWGRRYGVLPQHISMIFIPKENDSLLALPSEPMHATSDDDRNFGGPAYLFEHGGDRLVMIPDGVRVVDWPWPTPEAPAARPRDTWHGGVAITGNALEVGGKLLATAYGRAKGSDYDNSLMIASGDGGYTWRYFSTIAAPDPAHFGEPFYEGANETTMIRLADGDLMAVFRTGTFKQFKIGRAYSHDGGRTWTRPDMLPAWSVEPQLIRTANGTIALSTGRNGLYLWLSTDPRAKTWQSIDLAAFHNQWAPDPSYRISSFVLDSPPFPVELQSLRMMQTTAYTAMVETSPNKLLLIYDRGPELIAPAGPKDITRLFVLPVEIERLGN